MELRLDGLDLRLLPSYTPPKAPSDELAEYRAVVQELAGLSMEAITDYHGMTIGRLTVFLGGNNLNDHAGCVDSYFEEASTPKVVYVPSVGTCGLLRTGPNIIKRQIDVRAFRTDRSLELQPRLESYARQLAEVLNAADSNGKRTEVGLLIESHLFVPLLCFMWAIPLPAAVHWPKPDVVWVPPNFDPLRALRAR